MNFLKRLFRNEIQFIRIESEIPDYPWPEIVCTNCFRYKVQLRFNVFTLKNRKTIERWRGQCEGCLAIHYKIGIK